MKKIIAAVAVMAVVTIVGVIASDFRSLSAGGISPDNQRLRMYIVFAAYLGLLFVVREMLRGTTQTKRSSAGKLVKVILGSIGVAGASFIIVAVLALIAGGVEAFEGVMAIMFYLLPGVALLAAPLLMRWMR